MNKRRFIFFLTGLFLVLGLQSACGSRQEAEVEPVQGGKVGDVGEFSVEPLYFRIETTEEIKVGKTTKFQVKFWSKSGSEEQTVTPHLEPYMWLWMKMDHAMDHGAGEITMSLDHGFDGRARDGIYLAKGVNFSMSSKNGTWYVNLELRDRGSGKVVERVVQTIDIKG